MKHLSHYALFLTIFISACSKPVEKAIIGKWTNDKGKNSIEFFTDGTFLSKNGRMELSGHWSKIGDRRIKIDASLLGLGATMIGDDIHITENTMTLKVDGTPNTYVRMH